VSERKARIAFVKFAGLAAGGTERWLQEMAASLPRDRFEVDYYYCDAAPYVGSDYRHADTDPNRLEFMRDRGVNLIRFKVGAKNIGRPTHDWVDTDFWRVFDSRRYNLVQTAKAGPREYPYFKIPLPVVEFVTLAAGVDRSLNIAWTVHLSEWQRNEWGRAGGRLGRSSVIPIPATSPAAEAHLRSELGILESAVVAGFHQRADDQIFSPVPLAAFSRLRQQDSHFIIMGGGPAYRRQAGELGLRNVHFIEHSGESKRISAFLNTLDIFAHGRRDGETFGTVLAEAMMHGKPCLSHFSSEGANAQPETMGPGGIFAKSPEEYERHLEKLFTDPELRRKISAEGRRYASSRYTVPRCVEQLSKVYEQVLASGPFVRGVAWKSIGRAAIRKAQRLLGPGKPPPTQTTTTSYELHHGQYLAPDSLERHRARYREYEEANLFNQPEARYADLISEHPDVRSMAIDIGSGAGWLSARLSRYFRQVIGLEPSEAAVGMARALFPITEYPNIRWIVGFAEQELPKLQLSKPTLFVTATVLSHLPDESVEKICTAVNENAPVGSILSFAECWGIESHSYMWHIRTTEWWKARFPGWDLDFHGPEIEGMSGSRKGFHGTKKVRI
jgi:hypothetical protein